MELALDKTQAWSRRAPCPQPLTAHWKAAGLTLVGTPQGEPLPENGLPAENGALRVDAAPQDHAKERCQEVADRAAKLLERVAALPREAHQPAVQVAALLLRLCGCGELCLIGLVSGWVRHGSRGLCMCANVWEDHVMCRCWWRLQWC